MKVLLIIGSPREKGCTYTALNECAQALNAAGVDTEFFWIGKKALSGCMACNACAKLGRCVLDDAVNAFVQKAHEADGFIFGSPVYYAGMNASLMSLMDRAFYSRPGGENDPFIHKPAAAVVSARRAGTTAALDEINKYFAISQMPVISSFYWNMVHGNTPEQVRQDIEGLQIMRQLGRNMAWFLQLKQAAGIPLPVQEENRAFTNFVR